MNTGEQVVIPTRVDIAPIVAIAVSPFGLGSATGVGSRFTEVDIHALHQLYVIINATGTVDLLNLHGVQIRHIAIYLTDVEMNAAINVGIDLRTLQYVIVISIVSVSTNTTAAHRLKPCPRAFSYQFEVGGTRCCHYTTAKKIEPVGFVRIKMVKSHIQAILKILCKDIVFGSSRNGKVSQ